MANVAKRSLKILTFGNSLTAGYTGSMFEFYAYGDIMSEIDTNIQADTIGMSGWTTGQMVESMNLQQCYDVFQNEGKGLASALDGKKYDLVCIMSGTNDLGHGVDVSTITSNLNKFHDEVLRRNIQSLAIGIPESQAVLRNSAMNSKRLAVNGFLKELAEGQSGMHYMDCPVKFDKDSFSSDGLHMSRLGYQQLANGVLGKIKTICK